jgi:hypothetical protein
MKVSRFLKLHWSSCLIGESSITHCLNYQLNSPHLEAELKLDITRVALYSLRTDHAQKTRFYYCVRNITPRTSHVIPSQYCWSVTSCACVEVCLPSRNLQTDYNPALPLLVRVLFRNGWFCGLTFLAWGK